ncbi:hypothetical protein HETIRDRAFT_99428 [Heterobasidion irregulare TC 32-1]|uniref:DUF1754-domain-containing protein n=1 Tax=Heterobasidion irregulare (strain TC 32-1) TaxID=747525 RepID=W4KNR0_HETIT|nr:uncharacterized protein HETIRDRAFT_99428 [Heterobasidion irregulare TC 32-1]ETW87025.1 hypothetical protein HETIRDRAFT_99428 [Heterobasidion irregulare TC 32-1]
MSDYDFRPGGSLKIRGGVAEGGITKKKKKSKSKGDKDKKKDAVKEDSPVLTSSADGSRNSPLPGSSSDRKTEAERRFQEVQRKRLEERVKKLATKTHKDRVHEFNSKLEALSEHHDIPKVGPG